MTKLGFIGRTLLVIFVTTFISVGGWCLANIVENSSKIEVLENNAIVTKEKQKEIDCIIHKSLERIECKVDNIYTIIIDKLAGGNSVTALADHEEN